MIKDNLQNSNFHYLKLVELGEEYFDYNPKAYNDAVNNIKEAVKFNSFNLPTFLDEYFIKYYQGPVFWIIDSDLTRYLEDYIVKNVKTNIDNYNMAKELYTKWTINRNPEEKKYISASVARLIEKNQKDSCFLLNLYLAVILTYEKSIYNPKRANELFEIIVQEIEAENLDEYHSRKVKYTVLLYWAFLYFTMEKFEDARVRLQEAIAIFPENYTATTYLTICDIILGNSLSVRGSLSKIIELDQKRIYYSIEQNNFKMYDYFVSNNITSSIFSFPNIWIIYEDFENILDMELSKSEFFQSNLADKVKRIKNYPTSEYIKQSQWDVLSFFDKVLEKYTTHKSYLFLHTSDKLQNKISVITDDIISNIKQSFSINIEEKIKAYTIGIQEHREIIAELKKEFEEIKIEFQEEEKHEIEEFEKNLEKEVQDLEHRINNIHEEDDLNPKYAFQNAITIGIMIVLMVTILAGFASYSNNAGFINGNMSKMVSVVIASGLKWGLIVSVFVVIYALLAAGSVVVEKSKKKMQFIKRISDLKRLKDPSIEKIKAKTIQAEKELAKKYDEKIGEKEDSLNIYIHEKEQKEKDYYKEVEDTIQYEIDKFVQFINAAKRN